MVSGSRSMQERGWGRLLVPVGPRPAAGNSRGICAKRLQLYFYWLKLARRNIRNNLNQN